jgi:hypothetical protein
VAELELSVIELTKRVFSAEVVDEKWCET